MSDQSASQPLPSLIPLPGKVHLQRLEPVTAASPYLIPDASKEKGTEAVVLAIPSQPNYEYGVLVPCPLVVGQKVIIGKYSGEYDFRSQKITVIRIDEILAVIQEDGAGEPVDQPADGLPSAADLDAVASESDIQSATTAAATSVDRAPASKIEYDPRGPIPSLADIRKVPRR